MTQLENLKKNQVLKSFLLYSIIVIAVFAATMTLIEVQGETLLPTPFTLDCLTATC